MSEIMKAHTLSTAEIEALRKMLSCMDDDGQLTILCDMALDGLDARMRRLMQGCSPTPDQQAP
jgi:hypothetical protein